MKTEDTEVFGRQRAQPSKIKARYSQPTCKNCSYHCAPRRLAEQALVIGVGLNLRHKHSHNLTRVTSVINFAKLINLIREFSESLTLNLKNFPITSRH